MEREVGLAQRGDVAQDLISANQANVLAYSADSTRRGSSHSAQRIWRIKQAIRNARLYL